MITRSVISWHGWWRWSRAGRRVFREYFQQGLLHEFIKQEGACYHHEGVDVDGKIRWKKEFDPQPDGADGAEHDKVKDIDRIRCVTQQEDQPAATEKSTGPILFEENAAGDNEGGSGSPANRMEEF